MKYAYVVVEERSGTNIGVCMSMEQAIAYTRKLQKLSDARVSKFPEEHYTWFQLPLIDEKEIPAFGGNIGFRRSGSYSPWDGWDILPVGLVEDNSEDLLVDYTDKIPDVTFEVGSFGCVRFDVVSSAYVPEDEVLEFVKEKYREWVK